MPSFKKVQEMFCLGLTEKTIDEEEFGLLYEAYRPSYLPKGRYKNSRSLIQIELNNSSSMC